MEMPSSSKVACEEVALSFLEDCGVGLVVDWRSSCVVPFLIVCLLYVVFLHLARYAFSTDRQALTSVSFAWWLPIRERQLLATVGAFLQNAHCAVVPSVGVLCPVSTHS